MDDSCPGNPFLFGLCLIRQAGRFSKIAKRSSDCPGLDQRCVWFQVWDPALMVHKSQRAEALESAQIVVAFASQGAQGSI